MHGGKDMELLACGIAEEEKEGSGWWLALLCSKHKEE